MWGGVNSGHIAKKCWEAAMVLCLDKLNEDSDAEICLQFHRNSLANSS